MLGIRHGYYTEDAIIAWEIDSIIDYSQGIYSKLSNFASVSMSESVNDTVAKAFLYEWKKFGKTINQRLVKHDKKFIAGTDNITIADFACGALFYQFTNNKSSIFPPLVQVMMSNIVNSYPHLKRWIYASLLPEFRVHLDSRQEFSY